MAWYVVFQLFLFSSRLMIRRFICFKSSSLFFLEPYDLLFPCCSYIHSVSIFQSGVSRILLNGLTGLAVETIQSVEDSEAIVERNGISWRFLISNDYQQHLTDQTFLTPSIVKNCQDQNRLFLYSTAWVSITSLVYLLLLLSRLSFFLTLNILLQWPLWSCDHPYKVSTCQQIQYKYSCPHHQEWAIKRNKQSWRLENKYQ